MGGRYATRRIVVTLGAESAASGMLITALTDYIHSGGNISPGRNHFSPMAYHRNLCSIENLQNAIDLVGTCSVMAKLQGYILECVIQRGAIGFTLCAVSIGRTHVFSRYSIESWCCNSVGCCNFPSLGSSGPCLENNLCNNGSLINGRGRRFGTQRRDTDIEKES